MNPYSLRAGIVMLALLIVSATRSCADPISLSGPTTAWKVIQFAATNQFDYFNDSQAGSADLDFVGTATHSAIYTQFDDRGTTNTADDLVAYRVRLGGGDNNNDFSGVLLIGIDADSDGKLDLFLSADGRNNGRAVKIWSPGTGANVSPATTSITAPANQKIFPFASSNYNVMLVTPAADPIPNLNTNLNADAKPDIFLSFSLPFEDVRTEMQRLSGIAITSQTALRYVAITLTQNNSINGDIAGLSGGLNLATTYTDLGLYSVTTALNDTPPVFSGTFANQFTPVGIPVGPITFSVSDAQTASSNLTVTGTSSNTVLVPNANIVFGLSGTNRTMTVTPAAGQTGITLIQVIVFDGTLFATNQFTLTVTNGDITPPPVPVLTSIANDLGASPTDLITRDNTLVFNGTGEPNSTITIRRNGTVIGAVLANASGNWSFNYTSNALADGPYVFNLTATDAAGNTSAGTNLDVVIDTAIAPPGIPDLVAASDSGDSDTDNFTSVTTPTFAGTAEPGSSVSVYSVNASFGFSQLLGTVVATNGTWTLASPPLIAGTNSITAVASDVAGNTSLASTPLVVVIGIAPPSVPDLLAASDSGVSDTDNITSVTTPTFVGTAEAGSTVTLHIENIYGGLAPALGSTIATDGTWTITTLPLVWGTNSIIAAARAASGLLSPPSAPITVVIAIPPPSMPDLVPASDSGISDTDNITSLTTPTFTGTAEAGSTVTLHIDNIYGGLAPAIGSTIATNGTWTVTTLPLVWGTNSIIAVATSASGVMSASSVPLTIVIDIPPPSAPDLDAASDSGTSDTDNVTADATPTFTGTAEAGSTVTLHFDSIYGGNTPSLGSAIATNGTWTITTLPLVDGTNSIIAVATSASGVKSAPSAPLAVVIGSGTPVINMQGTATISEDGSLAPIAITLNDVDSDPGVLTLTVESSDTNLVPVSNVIFGGSGGSRSLGLTPASNASGTAFITVTVHDEAGHTASAQLSLTVLEVNDAPTLDALADLYLLKNAGPTNVSLTGISAGAGETQPISVSAVSANTNLLASVMVSYDSPASTAVVTFNVVSNATGSSVISVVIGDGETTITNSFTVTVLSSIRIVEHPVGDMLCAGDDTEFSVTAIGDGPLRYQWRFNGVELPDATNATFHVAQVQDFQVGSYDVRVSNPATRVLSRPASLAVVTDNQLRIVDIKVMKNDRSARLLLTGPIGQQVEIHGTFDFENWIALTNFTFSQNCFRFFDPQAAQKWGKRYYKLVPQP